MRLTTGMRNGARKHLGLISALLILGKPAAAQCGWVQAGYIPKKPVIADVVCQAIDITPWGTFSETLNGKFWRSKTGSTREDKPYNVTKMWLQDLLADVYMDEETRTATVREVGGSSPLALRLFGQGRDFDGAMQAKRAMLKGVLAGRAVTGERVESVLLGTSGLTWMANDLQLVVDRESKSQARNTASQVRNIEEREPDAALFKIPEDYTVVKCVPPPPTDHGPRDGAAELCRVLTDREKKKL